MQAPGLLQVESYEMIEPTYMALADMRYNSDFLSLQGTEAKMLIDEEEDPVAVAVNVDGVWKATSFLLRSPTIEIVEMLEEMDTEILQVEGEEWAGAVREHYALRIARIPPGPEDYSPRRKDMVKELMQEVWGDMEGLTCLDCGCGSGLGAVAARECGMWALGFDNDAASLSLGLHTGRLIPECTLLVDGTQASKYLEPADAGLVLMAGSINDFNGFIWKQVTEQMLTLCQKLLVTTETENEAKMVLGWCKAFGRGGRMLENQRDPFYDRWIVISE
jgi:hypothetical protein